MLKDFNEPASVAYKRKMVLNESEIEDLLEKTLNYVKDYANKSPIPVLVTSDSKTFLEKVKLIPNVFTTPGDLVHMNFTKVKADAIHFKPFLDFFMIMNSRKVVRAGTNYMYPSGFPKLASEIGKIEFEVVVL